MMVLLWGFTLFSHLSSCHLFVEGGSGCRLKDDKEQISDRSSAVAFKRELFFNVAFYFSQLVVTASFMGVFMEYLWLIRLPYLLYNVALEKFNTTKKFS